MFNSYLAQYLKTFGYYLDSACGNLIVVSTLCSLYYRTAYCNGTLLVYALKKTLVLLECNLHIAVMVTQIYKLDSSVVTDVLYPACNTDGLADVVFAQHFTGVSAVLVL